MKPVGYFNLHNGVYEQTSYRSLDEWKADKANFAPADWCDTPPVALYHEAAVEKLAFDLAERQNCLRQVDDNNRQLRYALRDQVVDEVGCICRLCYEEWDGEAERHAPGCLAALGDSP